MNTRTIQSGMRVLGLALLVCGVQAGPARAENEDAKTQKAEISKMHGDQVQLGAQIKTARAYFEQAITEVSQVHAQEVALERKKHLTPADRSTLARLKVTEKSLINSRKAKEANYHALQNKLRDAENSYHGEEKEHAGKK